MILAPFRLVETPEDEEIGAVLNRYTYRSRQTDRAQIVNGRLDAPRRVEIGEGKEMSATSHRRRSWKDSPTAKAIAATVSSLLIAALIAVLVLAFCCLR